jgi:hypothetical protein
MTATSAGESRSRSFIRRFTMLKPLIFQGFLTLVNLVNLLGRPIENGKNPSQTATLARGRARAQRRFTRFTGVAICLFTRT